MPARNLGARIKVALRLPSSAPLSSFPRFVKGPTSELGLLSVSRLIHGQYIGNPDTYIANGIVPMLTVR